MHLLSLNLPDLLIPLWRGTFECDKDDDKSTWTWASLADVQVWKAHGETVAASTVHIPGSFGRPPRNPAQKINSGYKAWEYHLYLYGLGPGLLREVLPDDYWRHFCKLVRAVRLISQHTISRFELLTAHRLFVEWIQGFEELYYQRRVNRIHFVRQSTHAPGHYAREVETKGPLICSSQWTMERTIGNLTEELRQHSDPYANLAERAIRRARINALKVMIPSLDPIPEKTAAPRWSLDIGGGYHLLPQHQRGRQEATQSETWAIREYLDEHAPNSPDYKYFTPGGLFKPSRWARLLLPNGQKCRSLFCGRERRSNARKARNVQVTVNGQIKFAAVQFFFELQFNLNTRPRPLALVSVYSPPDRELLEASSEALYSCKFLGDAALLVIEATAINQVVAMVPHKVGEDHCFFMFEQPGNDVTDMGGFLIADEDDEDDVHDT
ncbi:hypothetical protein BV22DRAFT_1023421 [Leucogyrophana mollusca]|uniref:Uncharacterized protein n=1 Tax=Leucogyrophana mollusca TaxID=85980 RepID=A0ACB8B0J6_9AGAM|nr:hypothetical protein BV22DRAFT_1023421 [Leucogyrophana mollusca]